MTLGGHVYHVLNRANGRLRIFRGQGDFAAFERIVAEGTVRFSMRLCGYCIMSNHWHLLLWPQGDADLPAFMHWVTATHAQRYHTAHATVGTGHLYQGRYRSFPVQSDGHYLTVLRYIEANPLRAGLVADASAWPWSSLAVRRGRDSPLALSAGPVELPTNWAALVHRALPTTDQNAVAISLTRGAPFGDPVWAEATAARLRLLSSLRPRGRPRKGA
jgi:putative transposase